MELAFPVMPADTHEDVRPTLPRPWRWLAVAAAVPLGVVLAVLWWETVNRWDLEAFVTAHAAGQSDIAWEAGPVTERLWRASHGRFGWPARPLPRDRPISLWLQCGIFDDAAAVELAARLRDCGGTRELRLYQADLTDLGGRSLAAVPDLEYVLFSPGGRPGSGVGDGTAATLARWDSLTIIRLPRSRLTDAGLQRLVRLPNLQVLGVSNSRVSRAGAWAFRTARPDVYFDGPMTPPQGTTEAEIVAYRAARRRAQGR